MTGRGPAVTVLLSIVTYLEGHSSIQVKWLGDELTKNY
jgi:hypothetical protein